jgi:hypothetical protein
MTQECKNDTAKTIKNTRESIENVAKMTTLQNLIAKQELMTLESCKANEK